MPEENISIFRQELERVKAQFEEKFQDIMASVRADRENDKRTLQMVNENLNNDRKSIDQNRALNDKLETLLNVQNTMLSELRSMNNSMKDLSGGGGGGMGGMLAAGGAAALAGAGAGFFLNGVGDNNVDGGGGNDVIRTTRGGGGTRDTGGGGQREPASGDVADRIRTTLMEKFTSEEMRDMGIDEEKAAMLTEAFIMNFQDESGLDPDIVERVPNVHGTRGRGLYQLTGPRRDEYESIYGEDYSVENQMDFMLRELMTSESSAFRRILQGETVGETAGAIVRDFLRPAAQHRNERMGRYSQDTRGGSAVLEEYQRMEEERQQREEEASAERVEGDITTYNTITGTDDNRVAVGKIPLRPGDDVDARMYHPRYSSRHGGDEGKDWADYSQFLYPVWEGGELPEGYSLGPNTRTITDPLTGEERRVSFNIVENNGFFTTSGPVVDVDENSPVRISPNSGTDISGQFGAELPTREQAEAIYDTADTRVEDIVGNAEGNDPRGADIYYTPQNGITTSGDAERRAFDAHLFREGGPFTRGEATIPEEPVVTPENDVTGGSTRERIRRDQDETITDTNDEDNTPLGPRIPETPTPETPEPASPADGDTGDGVGPVTETPEPAEPLLETPEIVTETSPEQNQFDPFSLVSPRDVANDLMVDGLDENPAVRAALEEQAADDREETPRETTSGGYTGGGGGSREQEQPQIESNAIGRFPWAEKIIKYYNLSNMIKTNMLS